MQTTSTPISEKQAPDTSPTYPLPTTAIFMALRNLFGSKFEVIPSGVPHAEPGYPDKDTNKRGQKASGPLFAFAKTKSKIRMGRERKTNGPVWTETLYPRRFRIGIFARIRLREALAEFFVLIYSEM